MTHNDYNQEQLEKGLAEHRAKYGDGDGHKQPNTPLDVAEIETRLRAKVEAAPVYYDNSVQKVTLSFPREDLLTVLDELAALRAQLPRVVAETAKIQRVKCVESLPKSEGWVEAEAFDAAHAVLHADAPTLAEVLAQVREGEKE